MREILQQEKGSSEKRFFHDYAYSLFEKELSNRNLLCTIEDSGELGDMTDKQYRPQFGISNPPKSIVIKYSVQGEFK